MIDSGFCRPLASISECFNWCVKSKGVPETSGNPLSMHLNIVAAVDRNHQLAFIALLRCCSAATYIFLKDYNRQLSIAESSL